MITTINGATQIRDASIPAAKVDSSIIIAAGTNAFSGDQSVGGHKLTSLGTPTASGDAATKGYVDNLINGKDWKESCRVGSTANVNIASAPSTIDGVTLANGDRILLKAQTIGSENGIYVFASAGTALTRAADFVAGEVSAAATTFITEGSTLSGTEWTLTTADPITIGSTSLTFTQSNASSVYTGSNGISVTGTVISPTYGSSVNTICQGNDSRLSDARTPVGTALTSANIWVGNGSNLAAAVAMSGEATISNAGAITLASTAFSNHRITRETPSGTVNGSNTNFTLANTPISGTEEVFVNGVLQDAGAGNDYTISTTTITFLSGSIPQTGDKVRVSYFK